MLFAMLVPIRNLGTVNIAIQNSLAAAERVFSILDVMPKINDRKNAKIITALNSKINFDRLGQANQASVPEKMEKPARSQIFF